MPTTWDSVIDQLFVGPMIPATALAMLCGAYTLVSMLGLFEIDVSDGGLDGGGLDGVDVGDTIHTDPLGGVGAATLRAVNLDRVPLVLWVAVFSVFLWLITFLMWFQFDSLRHAPTLGISAWLIVRNSVLAVVLTKFATGPLHRLLAPSRQYHAATLVGEHAVVETAQVDGEFGRARYSTQTAPLLILIRTRGETISKGTEVELLDYDATQQVYTVAAVRAPV